MTPRERIAAAIAGKAVDRPPMSLWQHFPERDQTPEDLTAATMAWQNRYHFDFVKYMPPGDYATIDWGLRSRYTGSTSGTRTATDIPITDPGDWKSLKPIDVSQGFNGMIVEAVRQTRKALNPDMPLLQTIFSPLTIAMKLSGGRAIEHLRAHPVLMHQALSVIRDVTSDMAAASFEAGADGMFFASQCADSSLMDDVEYREFGLTYDLPIFNATPPAGAINLVHFHGEMPMIHLLSRYPAQIVNWHDRHAGPNLAEGSRLTRKCVAGGINERTINAWSPDEIGMEVDEAIEQMNGRWLIVAPGCVIPTDTPEANVRAAIAAVRGE
jgi:uroporphyrinogen decarboxylase